jgi:type IV fimbrial biogenesis protein FimT
LLVTEGIDMRARAAGYTLFEMIITMMIAGILVAIGVPAFQSFTANQSIRTAGYSVTSSLLLARSEAVKRNAQITITPVAGGWSQGWTIAAPSETIQTMPALTHGTAIGSAAPASITFTATGRVSGAGTVQLPLSVTAGGQVVNRCISLDPAGMPRTIVGACS